MSRFRDTLGNEQTTARASSGTTIPTAGAQQALNRSEAVDIEFTDVQGRVYRPSMTRALVAKAAAFSVQDPDKLRHPLSTRFIGPLRRHSSSAGEVFEARRVAD